MLGGFWVGCLVFDCLVYFSLSVLIFSLLLYVYLSCTKRKYLLVFISEHMRRVNDAAISKYDTKDLGFPEAVMNDKS